MQMHRRRHDPARVHENRPRRLTTDEGVNPPDDWRRAFIVLVVSSMRLSWGVEGAGPLGGRKKNTHANETEWVMMIMEDGRGLGRWARHHGQCCLQSAGKWRA